MVPGRESPPRRHSSSDTPGGSRIAFSQFRKGGCPRREEQMLHWSLIFLIIAIIAAIFGFAGIAGAAAGIAKILFVVFLVIWLVAFIAGRRAV
jgi:uncharacterized membrane protein YtjA (UPF0391 family)